jgi:DUF971 family protein
MSFWDSIKPAQKVPVAVRADLSEDQRTLTLVWDDGVTSTVTAQKLRQDCPCAECVEEWTGRRTLDASAVPAELKIIELNPVGNYALTFTFGDMHRIGIFHWKHLRALSHGS